MSKKIQKYNNNFYCDQNELKSNNEEIENYEDDYKIIYNHLILQHIYIIILKLFYFKIIYKNF